MVPRLRMAGWAISGTACASSGTWRRIELAGAELGVRRQRADADRIAGLRDAFQLGHARDVDQRAGLGQPKGERRQQRLPAGQQLGLGPAALHSLNASASEAART